MAFTYYNTDTDPRAKGPSYEDEMLSWAEVSAVAAAMAVPPALAAVVAAARNTRVTRSSTGATSKSSSYKPAPQLPGANTKGFTGRKIDAYDRSFDGDEIGADATTCFQEEGSASGYHRDGFVVSDDDDVGGGAGAADEDDDDDSAWDPEDSSMTAPIRYRASSYVSPTRKAPDSRWTKKTAVVQSDDSDSDYNPADSDYDSVDVGAFLPTTELSNKSSLNDFLVAAGLDEDRIDITQFPPIPELMEKILVNFGRIATQFEDAGLTGLETGALLVKITDAIENNSSDSDSDYTPYVHRSEVSEWVSKQLEADRVEERLAASESGSDSDYSPSDDYDSDDTDYDGDGPDSQS